MPRPPRSRRLGKAVRIGFDAPRGGAPPDPHPEPHPGSDEHPVFFRAVAVPQQPRRRRGELDAADRRGAGRPRPPGALRLAAPGRAAVRAALRGERRRGRALRQPAPVAARAGWPPGCPAAQAGSAPAARRPRLGAGAPGGVRAERRAAAGSPLRLLRDGIPRPGAGRARRGGRPPGDRHAHGRPRLARRDPPRPHHRGGMRPDLQRGRCDQLSLGGLARPDRGQGRRDRAAAGAAVGLRRRHRRRRRHRCR